MGFTLEEWCLKTFKPVFVTEWPGSSGSRGTYLTTRGLSEKKLVLSIGIVLRFAQEQTLGLCSSPAIVPNNGQKAYFLPLRIKGDSLRNEQLVKVTEGTCESVVTKLELGSWTYFKKFKILFRREKRTPLVPPNSPTFSFSCFRLKLALVNFWQENAKKFSGFYWNSTPSQIIRPEDLSLEHNPYIYEPGHHLQYIYILITITG